MSGECQGWGILGSIIGLPTFHDVGKVVSPVNVQLGYADPSKLEVILEDSDRNKKKEAVMKYNGKKYSFIEDVEGMLMNTN